MTTAAPVVGAKRVSAAFQRATGASIGAVRLGRVARSAGHVIEGWVEGVRVGSPVQVERHDDWVAGEVIGFNDDRVVIAPVSDTRGIRRGALIRPTGALPSVGVGPALLGRVIDAFGRPIDGGPSIPVVERVPLRATPPPVHARSRVLERFETGVRVIDALLPCGRGQRVGLFAGAGVGKTLLIRQIAAQCQADIVVMGLVGERGCEARDLLGLETQRSSVLIVATSDRPPMERIRGAQTAMAVAESFRRQGKHVLLVLDSLTRYAMGLREVGLAAEEIPATKGYPSSVFARLPQLLERVCPLAGGGSITGFFTVLVEGDDLADPVADAARALLDGHVVLSRRLASVGHFPAIDVLESASRVALSVCSPDELRLAALARTLLSEYSEAEELRSLGAYTQGQSEKYDRALERGPRLLEWSRQHHTVTARRDTDLSSLRSIVGGGT